MLILQLTAGVLVLPHAALRYASWGVTYVKNDWCWHDESAAAPHAAAFAKLRDALNATGQHMVYNIHWNFDGAVRGRCFPMHMQGKWPASFRAFIYIATRDIRAPTLNPHVMQITTPAFPLNSPGPPYILMPLCIMCTLCVRRR